MSNWLCQKPFLHWARQMVLTDCKHLCCLLDQCEPLEVDSTKRVCSWRESASTQDIYFWIHSILGWTNHWPKCLVDVIEANQQKGCLHRLWLPVPCSISDTARQPGPDWVHIAVAFTCQVIGPNCLCITLISSLWSCGAEQQQQLTWTLTCNTYVHVLFLFFVNFS